MTVALRPRAAHRTANREPRTARPSGSTAALRELMAFLDAIQRKPGRTKNGWVQSAYISARNHLTGSGYANPSTAHLLAQMTPNDQATYFAALRDALNKSGRSHLAEKLARLESSPRRVYIPEDRQLSYPFVDAAAASGYTRFDICVFMEGAQKHLAAAYAASAQERNPGIDCRVVVVDSPFLTGDIRNGRVAIAYRYS